MQMALTVHIKVCESYISLSLQSISHTEKNENNLPQVNHFSNGCIVKFHLKIVYNTLKTLFDLKNVLNKSIKESKY